MAFRMRGARVVACGFVVLCLVSGASAQLFGAKTAASEKKTTTAAPKPAPTAKPATKTSAAHHNVYWHGARRGVLRALTPTPQVQRGHLGGERHRPAGRHERLHQPGRPRVLGARLYTRCRPRLARDPRRHWSALAARRGWQIISVHQAGGRVAQRRSDARCVAG